MKEKTSKEEDRDGQPYMGISRATMPKQRRRRETTGRNLEVRAAEFGLQHLVRERIQMRIWEESSKRGKSHLEIGLEQEKGGESENKPAEETMQRRTNIKEQPKNEFHEDGSKKEEGKGVV